MSFWKTMGNILPSVLGFGSTVGAAGMNLAGVREQNRANQQMAQQQMDFQERMSSTAYQRSMADMKAAGINPMLSAQLGGASTPMGASATMQNELGPAVSSAMDAQRSIAEIRNLREQNRNLKAQTSKIGADTSAAQADARLKVASAKQVESALQGIKVEEAIDKTRYGQVMRMLQRLNPLQGFFK